MPNFQRAPVTGAGLPGTVCAPDLFTRLDKSGGLPAADQPGPLRAWMGFDLNEPPQWDMPPEFTKPKSFVRTLYMAWTPGPDDPWYVAQPKKAARLIILGYWWVKGWLGDIFLSFGNAPAGCNRLRWQAAATDKVGKGMVATWVGFDSNLFTRISDYALNYDCPTLTIGAGDAITQYLVNSMSLDQCHDYAKLNGLCDIASDIIIDNLQYRTSMGDAITLWRRGHIGWQILTDKFRAQAGLNPDLPQEAKTTTGAWPAIQDIVRRGMLGVYSPGQVDGFQLGYRSESVKSDQAKKEWLGAGVDPQEIDEWWQSHWVGVGISQAYELRRRDDAGLLANGVTFDDQDLDNAVYHSAVIPSEKDAVKALWQTPVDIGTAYQLYARSLGGLLGPVSSFTQDDLMKSIKATGILPQYQDQVAALALAPIGRRQVKALYDDYIFDEGQVTSHLIADGMQQNDAQAMAQDWQKLRPLYTRRLVGGAGPGQLMSEFAAGTIGTSEYMAELSELGFNGAEQSIAVTEARRQRDRKTRGQLIAWLHARYIKGEVLEPAATAAMSGFGLDAEDIGNLIRLWRVELEVMPKEPSVAELLDWQCRGIISEEDLVTRLAQMRYQSQDIANMIAVNDLKCANQQVAKASKYLQQSDRGLTKAEAYWRKLLAVTQNKFGTVRQRTKTRAGQLLSVLKSELEGSPPVAKSVVGRAKAYIAQEQANGTQGGQSSSAGGGAVASAGTTPAANPASPGGPVASSAYPAQAPPTTESVVTGSATGSSAAPYPGSQPPSASPPGPQSYPSAGSSSSPESGAAGASETPPAAPP